MTIWFTSDLHFGHPLVARLRGYDDPDLPEEELVARHDTKIVNMINAHAGCDDTLYILGDVSSGSHRSVTMAAHALRGLNVPAKRRHLILGNHETRSCTAVYTELWPLFCEIANMGELDAEDNDGHAWRLILSHYPYRHLMDGEHSDERSTNATNPILSTHAPEWYGHRNERLLHGHTHAKTIFDFADRAGGYDQLHIGWDAWHRPVSLDELLPLLDPANARAYPDHPLDHGSRH
ncbi:metallophosphoesterase [Bifidobacterium sp. SO1]|uniref:metallophosphoesterase n=1 Tax=Bifidobacterium sp. SO1 TaxID=2809029 RepID=UPI001BDBC699|nr:metallophosphoesterase [Bifidobacterium sp. SO1]MBT1161756.1 metallophosphoesterase [Bifidobacterium sp. SO1]